MNDIITILLFFNTPFLLANPNVTFVILSQNNDFNNNLANNLQQQIKDQFIGLKLTLPNIFISNKHFNIKADWTIIPLISPILEAAEENTQCILFLEDHTQVSVDILMRGLRKINFKEEIWIGHALYDSEATIIHHFAFHDDPTFFKYPFIISGMVLSIPLITRLKTRIIENDYKKLDFHIDPAYEFAQFVYNNGKGSMIRHDDMFCSKENINCATYPKPFQSCGTSDASTIYFAVKTCQKFHRDRVKVVKNTWGKYTVKMKFFSDYEDRLLPTISLGIKNTEQGHCEKTIAILRYAEQEFKDDIKLQWLALVDDDTILSVSRLASLTTCHQNTTQPLILGERYRFGAQGFDYATGGAGILINRAALNILARSCNCPSIDSPDDMVLGACAEQYGIVLVHVPQMHQARPPDYAPGRLANQDSISFHKHWMIDPVETYRQWFGKVDYVLTKGSSPKTEL